MSEAGLKPCLVVFCLLSSGIEGVYHQIQFYQLLEIELRVLYKASTLKASCLCSKELKYVC